MTGETAFWLFVLWGCGVFFLICFMMGANHDDD
ncbi:hypothetical protein RCTITAN_3 [Rhodobacter phage RcTitan]|uniref:Uncharacterized protein n=1 Tax=Rhodobacter phage RcTitan TaxID=1662330 RepID=A0A0K1LLI6_9CAUD|nr:hypothetical protein RCTITAN_3 [Rhodobacter phage RcTitan]AKU43020.1 hypothetical protein RCTITAN_3 [Rhodobacter phage RcTitan]UUV44513.1 hypothetical protein RCMOTHERGOOSE_3 [Rhodobacter phage RcMotherGoose]